MKIVSLPLFFVQNFLPVMSGLSEESVQIREIQSIPEGLFCVSNESRAKLA